jgi:hypothetical protein
MKTIWQILDIPQTNDPEVIKKAYRNLMKKYHPDTVKSPEKKRHYTIKTVRINDAFVQALNYCNSDIHVNKIEIYQKHNTTNSDFIIQNKKAKNIFLIHRKLFRFNYFRSKWIKETIDSILFLICIIGLPYLIIKLNSFPLNSLIREIWSGLVVIPLGLIIGGIISWSIFPYLFILWFLDTTPLSKYLYKILWLALSIGNIVFVYYVNIDWWPFAHKNNTYYSILYHICRFVACFYLPIFGIYIWIKEYYQYKKVKSRYISVINNKELMT